MRMRVCEKGKKPKLGAALQAPVAHFQILFCKLHAMFFICNMVVFYSISLLMPEVSEGKDMGFVNEYASDEDIEKYELHEIWDKYHPRRRGDYYGGERPSFTIDRENKIFFMVIARGIREEGNQATFLLSWNGEHITGRIKQDGGSSELGSSPFLRVWHLLMLDRPESSKVSDSEVKNCLKDALKVYGYWGVRKQIPNTIVKFKF